MNTLKNSFRWRWLLWLLATLVSAAGLRFYTVDNALRDWLPEREARGPTRSYLLIGFDGRRCDPDSLAESIRTLPSVAFCVDPAIVRKTGWVAGVTPEHFVVGADGHYLGIFVVRKPDRTDDQLVAEVESALAKRPQSTPTDFALGGPAVFHVALNRISQQRLPLIMSFIVLVGGAMMWWLTGRLRVAASAMAAIVLSQIILVGLIAWQRRPMDMSLSMVPPLMMSLGFSYAAHHAQRRRVGRVLFLCCLTTALGVGTFALTDLTPVRRFGLYGVLGLLLTWLAVVSLVPPHDPAAEKRAFARRHLSFLLRWMLAGMKRYPRLILLTAGGLAGLAMLLSPFLTYAGDPLHYFPTDSRVVADFNTLNARLTGMLPFQLSIQGHADPTTLLLDAPSVRKVIDVTPFVGGPQHTWWCLADNGSLPALIEQEPRWQAWAASRHVQLQWTGVAAQLAEAERLITRVAVGSLSAMVITVVLVIALVHRSIRAALASLGVSLLPVLWLVLLVWATHWPLGMPSMMIGAILLGVAVDDILQVLSASRVRGSLQRGLIDCWLPCVGSSLVAAACMTTFALSPFLPTAQFGLLMASGLIFALAADMFVLPALLERLNPRTEMRKDS